MEVGLGFVGLIGVEGMRWDGMGGGRRGILWVGGSALGV